MQQFPTAKKLAVFPFYNHTETPQAGKRATAMLADILRSSRHHVAVYQPNIPVKERLEDPDKTYSVKNARAWARKKGFHYALLGSVNEWRYKVGLDGEPVASLTMRVINVGNGKTVWAAVGSKIGGSRSGLSNIAQELMNELLAKQVPLYQRQH